MLFGTGTKNPGSVFLGIPDLVLGRVCIFRDPRSGSRQGQYLQDYMALTNLENACNN